jgi:hypothetical protein
VVAICDLGDREGLDQHEVLVDHPDAVVAAGHELGIEIDTNDVLSVSYRRGKM